ncbi:MAG: imelysin family protein, partial [Roseibium sp.]
MKRLHNFLLSTACFALTSTAAVSADTSGVRSNYVQIAHAMFEDTLVANVAMQSAVDRFLADQSAENLQTARVAWKAARKQYQQTEVFRFGNSVVDDWEGRLNAWPLDEGLIDYVDSGAYGRTADENPLFQANIVANTSVQIGPKVVDTSAITPELIAGELHEALDVEANVATGYHAVEFMLWGQDLNGTGPGAGDRQASDFDLDDCTNRNCDRRRDYLKAAADLVVTDTEEMVAAWSDGGDASVDFGNKSDGEALSTILTGIAGLSYGELAGDRINMGLTLHDTEEEHDCFSDNTHNSHYFNQVGMMSVWNGQYERMSGEIIAGASVADVASELAPDGKASMDAAMDEVLANMNIMRST